MRAGQLRKRVTIERDTGTAVDAYNVHIEDWETIATRWAALVPVSGKELISSQQQKGFVSHKVTLRYGSDIADLNSSDRLKLGNRILNIETVLNEGERGKEFTLVCVEDVSRIPEALMPFLAGLSLSQTMGPTVIASWTPSEQYQTEMQYRVNEGEWQTLPLIDAGIGEAEL